MAPQEQTTIAILGPNSVPERVLAHLLEGEGYAVRLLKAPTNGALAALPEGGGTEQKLLGGVDVVLLWPAPTLKDTATKAFVGAMKTSPATARIPTLALSPALEVALQDELAVDAPLQQQFEYLMRSIEAILSAEAG